MPTIIEKSDPLTPNSLAALVERLGGIPPQRIVLQPEPGKATEEDAIGLGGQLDRRCCELVDGTLVEKPVGARESVLELYLGRLLDVFVDQKNLGVVLGPSGLIRLRADRVRVPDVAFISWERLPGGRVPDGAIWSMAPDLVVVEVLSESNTPAEIDQKRQEYFEAGVRLLWIADPKNRTVRVYTGLDECLELNEDQSLDGGTVLPGFTLSIREWFGRLDRQR